ncbi:MAG: hypothetical protein ACHQF4_00470 [Sphingobacteriales bacterium]
MGLFDRVKLCYPLLVVLFLVASCAVKKPVDYNAQPQTEAEVITTINNLPEVVKANVLFKKNSHGKKHLIAYIVGRPSASQSFYSVKVSEYNNHPGDTWFSFIVYPKTNKIYFLDTKKAKYISLAVWRRQRNYNPLK